MPRYCYVPPMKIPCTLLLVVASAAGACKKEAQKVENSSAHPPAFAPLDYVEAQAKAKQAAERTISMTELTQAIQKFQAMEDRYPRDFKELVTEHYLASLPVPPPGTQFAYSPSSGSVRVVPAGAAPASTPPADPTQRRRVGGINVPTRAPSSVSE